MVSTILKVIAWLSLGVLVFPALWFLAGHGSLDRVKTIMLIATVVWFLSAGISQKNESCCHNNER